MKQSLPIKDELVHMAFLQREDGFAHHAYDEELLQYEYVRAGDPRAVEESSRIFNGCCVGRVSDDPLRNKRYLFVCAVTLATRFAMEGGVPHETAYNLSDLFIRRMDRCESIEEIIELHHEMFAEFTAQVAKNRQCWPYSKAVHLAVDFIHNNLHRAILTQEIADFVGLNRSYLSVLFRRETGVSVSDFIRDKRVETAENMLRTSSMSLQEIADTLAFNTQSHFISVFKKKTGCTPGEYRKQHDHFKSHANG